MNTRIRLRIRFSLGHPDLRFQDEIGKEFTGKVGLEPKVYRVNSGGVVHAKRVHTSFVFVVCFAGKDFLTHADY